MQGHQQRSRTKALVRARQGVLGGTPTVHVPLSYDTWNGSCLLSQLQSLSASAATASSLSSKIHSAIDLSTPKLMNLTACSTISQSPCTHMKKPAYCEAAVGWDDEDFQADVKAFGVPNCEAIHRSLLCGGSISHLQPPGDICHLPGRGGLRSSGLTM